jgi:hypothetical protein
MTLFKTQWINRLHAKPLSPIVLEPGSFLTTFIDPGSGGCTLQRTPDGNTVIIGLYELEETDIPTLNAKLVPYWSFFQEHLPLHVSPHFVCVETNVGGTLVAREIIEATRKIIPTIVEKMSPPPAQLTRMPPCL